MNSEEDFSATKVQKSGKKQNLEQTNSIFVFWIDSSHRGQNSKQINVAECISKFLIYGANILDKCFQTQKKIVHCSFLQSQAKKNGVH